MSCTASHSSAVYIWKPWIVKKRFLEERSSTYSSLLHPHRHPLHTFFSSLRPWTRLTHRLAQCHVCNLLPLPQFFHPSRAASKTSDEGERHLTGFLCNSRGTRQTFLKPNLFNPKRVFNVNTRCPITRQIDDWRYTNFARADTHTRARAWCLDKVTQTRQPDCSQGGKPGWSPQICREAESERSWSQGQRQPASLCQVWLVSAALHLCPPASSASASKSRRLSVWSASLHLFLSLFFPPDASHFAFNYKHFRSCFFFFKVKQTQR